MNKASASNHGANDTCHWHKKHSTAYLTALEAVKRMMPAEKKHGVQICLGTDPFLTAPDVPICRSPLPVRGCARAVRGFSVRLPYDDCSLDFALVCRCDGATDAQQLLFREVYRVLAIKGLFIVGFVDIMSPFGEKYLIPPLRSADLKKSINGTEKIMFELSHAGFKHYELLQTLLDPPEKITEIQTPIRGYGQGSFVVVQAAK